MKTEALIQAAGIGSRLKLGPKAFVKLGGSTLLELAVKVMAPVVDHVLVAVSAGEMARAQKLIDRERVHFIEGGQTRSETTQRLIQQSSAPWLVLHDVVHPFVKSEMITDLLDAAFRFGAAAPVIANADFLYSAEGKMLHSPNSIRIGQKPVAFSRAAALEGYARSEALAQGSDPSLLEILEMAGVRTHFTQGDAMNIKITMPGDLRLARAMIRLDPS
jgi:2-C-methyl-D-erythritol 4-phosphate cytidylyltransferase